MEKTENSARTKASELTQLLSGDFKKEKYLNENKRIKRLFWYPPALISPVFVLQIKKGLFWKTVSWIYVSVIKERHIDYIQEWLEWSYSQEAS